MKTGTTSTGFKFAFDETNADDMRVLDLIVMVNDENAPEFDRLSGGARLAELLLGKEQKTALYDHIAKAHGGRVPIAVFSDALAEIMQGGGDAAKNS